ncbi:MAG: polymer-forming cytoskeletal protein [Alphaproteobacteria bacterium]|nr:polymer-forming cytoskeletal protein [Alphaproteobacteria bacterium]
MSETTNVAGELFLGEGVVVNCFALVPGKATLNGQFVGALNAKEIEVQANGNVNGTIEAEVITVDGQLNNSIHATNTLHIGRAGVVRGDVSYGKLEIAKGGEVQGVIKQI